MKAEIFAGKIGYNALTSLDHARKRCSSCQSTTYHEPCLLHQKIGHDKHCDAMERGCNKKTIWHACEEHKQPDITGDVEKHPDMQNPKIANREEMKARRG